MTGSNRFKLSREICRRLRGSVVAGIAAIALASGALAQSGGVSTEDTIVRFSTPEISIDVTIGEDNPTVVDFLSRLPLTMTLSEFSGREKIGYFPSPLDTRGSPGSDPVDGDLIYFVPWGNIGFYYNTSGIGYSDQTIHLGTYDATVEQLQLLENSPVRVELVDR